MVRERMVSFFTFINAMYFAGIIKHLTKVPVEHPYVARPICQEATRVCCKKVNGEWSIEVPPAIAVPSGSSWSSIVGFDGNAEASIGSSERGNALLSRLLFVS